MYYIYYMYCLKSIFVFYIAVLFVLIVFFVYDVSFVAMLHLHLWWFYWAKSYKLFESIFLKKELLYITTLYDHLHQTSGSPELESSPVLCTSWAATPTHPFLVRAHGDRVENPYREPIWSVCDLHNIRIQMLKTGLYTIQSASFCWLLACGIYQVSVKMGTPQIYVHSATEVCVRIEWYSMVMTSKCKRAYLTKSF